MIQTSWNWCNKCQGLFYAGLPGTGSCPAGGSHNRGTASYTLSYNATTSQTAVGVQSEWAWCGNCYGLWYGPNGAISKCPYGGRHWNTGGNYVLIMNAMTLYGEQNWARCNKCQGMVFGPNASTASCPAGGPHDVMSSPNYDLALNMTEPLVPTSDEWLGLTTLFPNLTASSVLITDQPTPVYNCIAYSLGYTDRWINPQNPLSAFQSQYAAYGYSPLPANSLISLIDGWGLVPEDMTHGDRLFPVGEAIWESKLGALYRITHNRNDLDSAIYGSVLTSFTSAARDAELTDMTATSPDEPSLSADEIAQASASAAQVPANLSGQFESALARWRDAVSESTVRFSSDSNAYATVPEYDVLAGFGAGAIPLVMTHLSDADGFMLLPLLERLLGSDPAPKVHPLESEQSRARRAVRTYLGRA